MKTKNAFALFVTVTVACVISISSFGQPLPAPSDEEMKAFIPVGVIFKPDIPYRDGNPAWKLDLYTPAEKSNTPRPAIVFIHGGGFRHGDKRYRFTGEIPWYFEMLGGYAKAGYVVISINYRLSREAPFPAAINDVKTAIRWLRANAKDLNVDPNRVGAFGHSAGGELAAFAALVGPKAGFEGDGPYQEQSSVVQTAVVAALNVRNDTRMLGAILYQYLVGPNETVAGLQKQNAEIDALAKKASLITYVHPDSPPLLIIHGTDDFLPYENVVDFVDVMREAGNKNIVLMGFHGDGHAAFINNYSLVAPAVRSFFDSSIGAISMSKK